MYYPAVVLHQYSPLIVNKQTKIDSSLGQSKEHYRNLLDLEEGKKKLGQWWHVCLLLKASPGTSKMSPFWATSPPCKALHPQGLYPYLVFSSCPTPTYKPSGDLLTPSPPHDPRALISSRHCRAPGCYQLLRCSWQALRLRGMRAFLWPHVRSQCDYSTAADILSLNLRIFSNIAAPFLNIPDTCNSPVPARVVFNWFEMCITTERHILPCGNMLAWAPLFTVERKTWNSTPIK